MADEADDKPDAPTDQPAIGWWGRLRRVAWRAAKWTGGALLLYCFAVLVGQWPVNTNFKNVAGGVEVFIYVDYAHSEIIVPRETSITNWNNWFKKSDFKSITGNEEYVSFSWGDRDFFFETEKWDDTKASVVAQAMLWPTSTVMHVAYCRKPYEDAWYRRVVIAPEKYAELARHIQKSFELDGPTQPKLIADRGYNQSDTFYEARGTYSAFYTCNNWTGDGLRTAGVKTGWWTPFPAGVLQIPPAEPVLAEAP